MPKFGLKCFLGSFLLSLTAVFVATKAYLIMSLNERTADDVALDNIETKNIELFASNEENDPLYDKFNQIEKETVVSGNSINQTVVLESDNIIADADTPLYTPNDTDKEDDENSFVVAENGVAESEINADESTESAEEEFLIVQSDTHDSIEKQSKTKETDELQIADASLAPVFNIPLLHGYDTVSAETSVSNEADNSQIAMATHDVAINNLGLEKKASVTETAVSVGNSQSPSGNNSDDPWEVAEAANKHLSRNTLNNASTSEHPAQDANASSGETKVAYKMQKNLLIPIPEEIMNEKNLTPQISSSAENIKLEDELRANKTLPALEKSDETTEETSEQNAGTAIPVTSPFEDDAPNLKDDLKKTQEDEKASRSLSDSIAAWFSNTKSKSSSDDIKAVDRPSSSESRSNRDQSNSIFNKLLGAKKNNVTPTELKLFFQPNRAEISGQTLEWIRAFADNAAKYENVVVEIRIDKSLPYDLQQKRLRLLYRILANNGVDYSKINIIFTDREPNSFIIRNVRYATDEEQAKNVKTYNPWL